MAIQSIPIQTFSAGTFTSSELRAPNNSTQTIVTLQSDDWTDPTLTVEVQVEKSEDNGQTWEPWGGCTTVGGAHDRFGNMPSFRLDYPAKSGFRIRGSVTVNQTCRLGFAIEST